MNTTELFDSVNINGQTYKIDPSADIAINRSDINGEIESHAGKFAWYATSYELAVANEMDAKAEFARVQARLDVRIRETFKTNGIKGTEAMVGHEMCLQDEYIAAQNAHREASLQVGLLKAQRDAMLHRRDMLVALAHNFRAEGFSDINLKADAIRHNAK